ncbi:putative ABC transport system permease protein [Lachnospiraceae bacterium YSD2013]|nr:putative ABC transport system permease protein [Lachnospiraceae bacterium YSD2013]
MLGIMLEKMWHKKWMNVCLLLGCILLTATVVSFPIYRAAAYNRMINDEFENYISTEGRWPTMISATVVSRKEKGGSTLKKMDEFPGGFYDRLKVKETYTFRELSLSSTPMSSETGRGDAKALSIKLAAIGDMTDHIKLLAGELYSEAGKTEDGAIEVLISQSCMVDKGLLVNEYFTFDDIKAPDGKALRVYVKGVYDSADELNYFWQIKPEKLNDTILCREDVFRSTFMGDNVGKYTITSYIVPMFDYESVKATDVDRIYADTKYYMEESPFKSVLKDAPYVKIFDDYNKKLTRISATLIILQVPVLAMLAAFLFMISGQMYEMEKSEISVIKSRGSSSGQIIRLYFYQGLVLTLTGAVIGMPLGALFAKVLGSTRNFLEFDFSQSLNVSYTKESLIYALAAIAVCLLSITIPSFKHSKVTIVNLKQSNALKKKSWWEKLFIDILLLGVSLYGFYSFNKNMKDLSGAVMSGESLDPLLYISSSLFIVGAGMFFLRIQPHLVSLVYKIGKKWWGPASHVSFMENIKNGRKQQLIMLFLIMTISLGMYHATVARTILDNAVENTEYLDATDVIIKEVWTEITDRYGSYTGDYIVPDYSKYNTLTAAKSYTRVFNEPKGRVGSNTDAISTQILGINTKEFGAQTMVSKEFLEKHYYEYLNDLAVVEDGVLLSRNFNTKMGYNVGDSIIFSNSKKKPATCKIVGFFDYFPSYAPMTNGLNPDGTAFSKENYLIVANYDYLAKKWGTYPYEVWIQLKDDATAMDVYNWVNEQKLSVKKYENRELDLKATMGDPLLQGTNGVLTMGFVVTIVLCAVGYLIYWVMSIRERELIFGVLRATGFHKGEIFHMLLNEQVFSGVLSIFAGIGIGKLTSKLFVPILQQAYSSENQALPMRLITVASDMYRLYGVIATVMIVVLLVLVFILFRMNVTKALKLGEE